MFRIFKTTVNSTGNTVQQIELGLIDATRDEVITSIANKFHKLAITDNLRLKVFGSDFKTYYVFEPCIVHATKSLNQYITAAINENINDANDYIKELNIAVKRSNKRNNRKANTNIINAINLKDYLIGDGSSALVYEVAGDIVIK